VPSVTFGSPTRPSRSPSPTLATRRSSRWRAASRCSGFSTPTNRGRRCVAGLPGGRDSSDLKRLTHPPSARLAAAPRLLLLRVARAAKVAPAARRGSPPADRAPAVSPSLALHHRPGARRLTPLVSLARPFPGQQTVPSQQRPPSAGQTDGHNSGPPPRGDFGGGGVGYQQAQRDGLPRGGGGRGYSGPSPPQARY
jgi:hypothetical protein